MFVFASANKCIFFVLFFCYYFDSNLMVYAVILIIVRSG